MHLRRIRSLIFSLTLSLSAPIPAYAHEHGNFDGEAAADAEDEANIFDRHFQQDRDDTADEAPLSTFTPPKALEPALAMPPVTFAAIGDLHYGRVKAKSQLNVIQALNYLRDPHSVSTLKSKKFNAKFSGLLVLGDATENGQKEEWAAFVEDYGLKGEKKVKMPVYELAGNHEYPALAHPNQRIKSYKEVYTLGEIAKRNKLRGGVVDRHPAGMYVVKWGDVVLVNLGVKASNKEESISVKSGNGRHTPPFGALTYLKKVLANPKIINDRSKIVLAMHFPLNASQRRFSTSERMALFHAIREHNVVAILHAHRHSTSKYRWCGIPSYNIGGPKMVSGHPDYDLAYAVFQIDDKYLRAMTVSWRFDGLKSAEDLNFGRACNIYDSQAKDSHCWQSTVKLSKIKIDQECY